MTVWLSLVGIVAVLSLCSWLVRVEGRRRREAMRHHAARENIRQTMDLHPHERGEVPAAEEAKVDHVLALRIAQGLSRGLWTRRLSR